MKPRTIFLLVTTLALASCLGSDFADSVQGAWQLESGTFQGVPVTIVDTHPITMELEDEEISGTAACNGYGGTFDLSGSRFEIDEGLAVTEMACIPSEVMDSERQFLEALVAVDAVELTSGRLVLSGNEAELTFRPLDPSAG